MQEFHHAQLIAAPAPAEFYRIHAFPYEMQPQAAGPHVLQVASAESPGVDPSAVIFEHNFKGGASRAILRSLDAL